MQLIRINSWGTVGIGAFTVEAADTEGMWKAIGDALSAKGLSIGGNWCGQGRGVTHGRVDSHHYSAQADVWNEKTGESETGQIWISIDADADEAFDALDQRDAEAKETAALRDEARELYEEEGKIKVLKDAEVVREHDGVWVAAWVRVERAV